MDVTENLERRRVPRFPIIQPLPARARGAMHVRILDLSLGGVRVEHFDLLRPGSACPLELPPALESLILTTYVARSTIVGVKRIAEGDRHLRYESGLAFIELTANQAAVLTRNLERITAQEGAGISGN